MCFFGFLCIRCSTGLGMLTYTWLSSRFFLNVRDEGSRSGKERENDGEAVEAEAEVEAKRAAVM